MAINYKIGDRVKRINGNNEGMSTGDTGIVVNIDFLSNSVKVIPDLKPSITTSHTITNMVLAEELTLNKMQPLTNIIEKFRLITKGEPEKSFIKSGVTASNGDLTVDGTKLFLQYLLEKNKTDFNSEIVQKIIKESEEK